jgi:hypothetical protein
VDSGGHVRSFGAIPALGWTRVVSRRERSTISYRVSIVYNVLRTWYLCARPWSGENLSHRLPTLNLKDELLVYSSDVTLTCTLKPTSGVGKFACRIRTTVVF